MQTVKVEKDALLEKLRENRAQHRQQFEEALEGYKKALESALRDRIEQLRSGVLVDKRINLPEPEEHTRDYDRVITMVEMSVQDEIELSQQEFAQYVMDDWGWKGQFTATTSSYTNR